MERIEIKGLDEALRKLRGMPENVKTFVGRGLYAEAQVVMQDSTDNYVPVDTGVLKGSGFVRPPSVTADEISVVLGFGGPAAPYALAVHENPRAGKTGGLRPLSSLLFGAGPRGRTFSGYKHYAKVGEWKFLETPLLAAQPKIKAVIAGAVGEAFEKG